MINFVRLTWLLRSVRHWRWPFWSVTHSVATGHWRPFAIYSYIGRVYWSLLSLKCKQSEIVEWNVKVASCLCVCVCVIQCAWCVRHARKVRQSVAMSVSKNKHTEFAGSYRKIKSRHRNDFTESWDFVFVYFFFFCCGIERSKHHCICRAGPSHVLSATQRNAK